MSSFICSSEHFNSCQAAFERIALSSTGAGSLVWEVRKHFPAIASPRKHGIDQICEEVESVFDELRRLSVLCVSLQYAHHHEGTLDTEIEQETKALLSNKEKKKELSFIALFSALKCIEYQIEPDHLQGIRALTECEQIALDFLKCVIPALAMDIVRNLPEYEKVDWEINL